MELQEATSWLLSKGLARASATPASSASLVWLNGILIPVLETSPTIDQV